MTVDGSGVSDHNEVFTSEWIDPDFSKEGYGKWL